VQLEKVDKKIVFRWSTVEYLYYEYMSDLIWRRCLGTRQLEQYRYKLL